MTDICRLCASLKRLDHLITIADPSLSVKTKLLRCCQVELPANDDFMPQNICTDCISNLNNSWVFAEKVHQAQETLKQAFMSDFDQQMIETQKPVENGGTVQVAMPTRRKEPSFKIRSMIVSLHLKGYSIKDICQKLHLEEHVVSDWIFTYQTCVSSTQPEQPESELSHHFETIPPLQIQPQKEPTQEQQQTNNINHHTISIPNSNSVEIQVYDDEGDSSNIDLDLDITEVTDENQIQSSFKLETELNIECFNNIKNEMVQQTDSVPEQHSQQSQQTLENVYLTVEEQLTTAEKHLTTAEEHLTPSEFDEIDNEEEEDDDDNDDIEDGKDVDTVSCHEEEDENIDSDVFVLSDSDKNSDGTISAAGLKNIPNESWLDYPWDCSECGVRFTSVTLLREHHTDNHLFTVMRYQCIDCSMVFSKYSLFVRHVGHQHRPHLKYCCDICYMFFWRQRQLREHAATHSQDQSFLCQTCGKNFKSSSALQIHRRSHLANDEKPKFECNICRKVFGTKPNLMIHKRIHTGVRDHTCDQCGKSFVQKGNLDNHMLTHVSNTPFTCDICGKTFKTHMRLYKHKTVHTGQKPHKCDQCNRTFREKGTLREHIRIHTGDMPFECEFCGKRFRFKGVLTTHRRQHTGERPYSCVECNHHFTNWPNYNKHMKRRHGINTSVTVRKPQAIPPSGMPAKAKQNHVVVTVDNNAKFGDTAAEQQQQQHQQDGDGNNVQLENSVLLKALDEKDIHLNNKVVEFVAAASAPQGLSVAQESSILVPHELISRQDDQITVLSHPTARAIHQVINGNTAHYSYIPSGAAMVNFYNLQGVDVELMHSTNNIQR